MCSLLVATDVVVVSPHSYTSSDFNLLLFLTNKIWTGWTKCSEEEATAQHTIHLKCIVCPVPRESRDNDEELFIVTKQL